jgi:hypothetical protein
VASNDASFDDACEKKVAGHDSFVMETEAEEEVNAGDSQAKGNVDDTVVYGLGSSLRSAEESGFVRTMVNDPIDTQAGDVGAAHSAR